MSSPRLRAARGALALALALALAAGLLGACHDPVSVAGRPGPSAAAAPDAAHAGATLAWNQVARDLVATRRGAADRRHAHRRTGLDRQLLGAPRGHRRRAGPLLAARYRRSERDAARTLALLNMAAYDAIVASHEAKYHYWLIRPSQADPGIVRAVGLPNFPSYPSNHAALASVAATVLGARFPGERARLDATAQEGARSRVYGGIHYRSDVEAGLALGRRVGAHTLAHDVVGRAPFVLP